MGTTNLNVQVVIKQPKNI